MSRLDPITFEVVKNALSSIADEMALVIMRSAYSPVVRDSMDYSTALCDRHGQIIAQGLTLAVQLGAFPDGMRHLLAQYGNDVKEGDIFLFNDPYGSGGQHLPDIYVIKPVFHQGQLEGWACTMAHHSDVGGIAPGSTAMHATEIHQEGLTLPTLKLYEQGKPNTTLFRIIEKNTRQPVQVLGDLKAQLAACAIGERGYLRLLEKYGAASLHPYLDELQDQAERMMRQVIRDIPDGVYKFEDWIDGIGDVPEPIKIAVTVTVKGDEVDIDLTGTSKQVPAAINCPISMVNSSAYCAIRCMTSTGIPNCQGYMRPITIRAPEGTIVNPLAPAACAARGVIGYRVFDAIIGALAQVVPDKVMAGGEGGPTLLSIGGRHRNKAFVLTEVMVGNWGARATKDGVEGISNPAANLSNQPVELIEAELPLEITHYALVPDTGGAGRHRGGLAFSREYRLTADEAVFTLRSDRRDHPPYGIARGQAGAPSRNLLIQDGRSEVLPTMPMKAMRLKKGDVFCHISAGGGGYGDARERDPALVLSDVIAGKVSAEVAREVYGVAIDGGKVDLAATARLRQALRTAAQ
ncbi:MAG: hydantoinase B/oxoprolinase family protein [Alphaproteobacteria bacterium]|nr:hydantoinase B/oxoprolinase family protein [Alphaproteobacteria bacterium]